MDLTVALAIVAIVQRVKESYPAVNGLMTMLLAMALGAVAGYFHLEGLDLASGVMTGIGAVGGVTVAQKFGGSR